MTKEQQTSISFRMRSILRDHLEPQRLDRANLWLREYIYRELGTERWTDATYEDANRVVAQLEAVARESSQAVCELLVFGS
jgi:hypothetical protein